MASVHHFAFSVLVGRPLMDRSGIALSQEVDPMFGSVADVLQGQICQAKLEKWSNQMYQEPEAAPVEVHMFDLDCLLSDISDTLFTMTQKQPCPWASDRHDSE